MRLKIRLILFILLLLLFFAFISGCNTTTEEDAINSAKESFQVGFTDEPIQPDQEAELFSYFLPIGLSVEETNENNLILSRGNQLYLIFSNPAENARSKVNYNQDVAIEDNPISVDTLDTEEAFSYLIISPIEDEQYKVIVGSGGEKATTITDKHNLNKSVELMIDIVRSISYK